MLTPQNTFNTIIKLQINKIKLPPKKCSCVQTILA